MLRSLFAGVSGLRAHQTMMDVLGSNIANVNTVGYRTGRMSFQDLLSQTLSGGQSSSGTRGGMNPVQVGLGAQIGAVDTIFSQGNFQTTERLLDLAIQGNGFFQLVDEQNNAYFTRAGNFGLDHEGYLVNPGNGLKLYGLMAGANGIITDTQTPEALKIDFSMQSDAIVTSEVTLGGNLDSRAEPEAASTQSQLLGLYDDLGRSLNLRIGDVIQFSSGTIGGISLIDEDILTIDSNTTLGDLADAIEAKLQTLTDSSSISVTVSSEGGIRISTDASNPLSDVNIDVKGNSNEALQYVFQNSLAENFDNDFDVSASSFADTRAFRQADVSNSIKVYDSQGNARSLTTTFAKDTSRIAATGTTLLSNLYNLKSDGLSDGASYFGAAGSTLLTDLLDGNGDSVGLSVGDVVTFDGGTIAGTAPASINLSGLNFTVQADSTLTDLLDALQTAIQAIDLDSGTAGTQAPVFTYSISAAGVVTFNSSAAITDMAFTVAGAVDTPGIARVLDNDTTLDGMDIPASTDTNTQAMADSTPHYVVFSGGSIGGINLDTLGFAYEYTETSTLQDLLDAMDTALEGAAGSPDVSFTINSDGTISISSSSDIVDMQVGFAGQSDSTTLQALFEEKGSTGTLDGIDVTAGSSATTQSFRDSVIQKNTWNWRALVPHTDELLPTNDSGTITFTSDGKFSNYGSVTATSNPSLEFDPDGLSGTNGGVDKLTITLDMQALTQYATASTASIRSQDGQGVGTLDSINIDTEGTITGVFTNGATVDLARLQLAYFSNEGGLRRVGDSMFQQSGNSGLPVLGSAGEDGRGTISSGTLELSNVDLAQQFTDLIVAQRGFQANSRVITTSDEILTEVVNLKR